MAKSYYNPNTNRRRRTRLRWDRIAVVVAGGALVFIIVFSLNFNRVRSLFKGYSFKETKQILNLKKSQQKEVLSQTKIKHILVWIDNSSKVVNYDEYEKYYTMFPEMDVADVILTVDSILELQESLSPLGYTDDILWKILKKATVSDLNNLITNKYGAEELMKYYAIDGFIFSNYDAYRTAFATYGDYAYAVNYTNYPFLISSNSTNANYLIKNPEELLVLVKKGFYFAEDYVPSDLVIPEVNIVEDCENCYVRKIIEADLKEMFSAAKTLGYNLYIRSAYRSYSEQQATYDDIEYRYGGAYAAEYVALPGASEHQTGLGIDLTSQNVLDGVNNVFSDTVDYQWVLENSYKYGFIVRFDETKKDITGIAHEPWHLRYVGKEVAKIIYEQNLTFEEYCLKYSVLPNVEER